MRKGAAIAAAVGLLMACAGAAEARYDGAASYHRAHPKAWSVMRASWMIWGALGKIP